MRKDIINGVLGLGESDTSLPLCMWCWMKYHSCLQVQYQTVSIIFMTFLVRWSRMRMLDDISTTNRLLGFGRLNLGLGLVWGCRMTSAPSKEYWDWGEEPPRLNLGQLLPLQTFRLVAKSNLWKLLKSSAFQQYYSRPEKKLAQLSSLSYKSSQTQSFSKVAQKCT